MSGGTTLADSAGAEIGRAAMLREFALAQPMRRVAAALFALALLAALQVLYRRPSPATPQD